MVSSMVELASEDRRRLAERLRAESGGNPFYVGELVAGLADAGLITVGADGLWHVAPEFADQPFPLPAGVRDAVRERIERLGDAARVALGAAAVIGRRVDASLLEAVAGLAPDEYA